MSLDGFNCPELVPQTVEAVVGAARAPSRVVAHVGRDECETWASRALRVGLPCLGEGHDALGLAIKVRGGLAIRVRTARLRSVWAAGRPISELGFIFLTHPSHWSRELSLRPAPRFLFLEWIPSDRGPSRSSSAPRWFLVFSPIRRGSLLRAQILLICCILSFFCVYTGLESLTSLQPPTPTSAITREASAFDHSRRAHTHTRAPTPAPTTNHPTPKPSQRPSPVDPR